MTDTKREAPASLEKRAVALEIVLRRRGESTLGPSGSGCPPRSPRPHDVICHTRTRTARGAAATATLATACSSTGQAATHDLPP